MTREPAVDWAPTCSLDALVARADTLAAVRAFFRERGVLEVQTGVIGTATVTEPAVESIAVPGLGYLQTSPEYQMKRLLAAGAPSIYQLGPVFRAGEAGRRHNPEFTMLEWYRLGWDDLRLIDEVAALVAAVLGPAPHRLIRYADVVARAPVLPDVHDRAALTARELLDLRFSLGLDALPPGRWFVIDYPADQAALARLRADDPTVAARFELVIDGLEIANGYHELTDAAEQRRRFETDRAARRTAGQHVPAPDARLLAALDHGLPACAGVALGFDRLLMLKLGVRDIRAVIPFPIDRA
ncbi:MAG: EF-P lysine aminoacylase GenX [Pseudomonadales bacterium]|nr:EF-P lysine aminoacylase GenX [Pseudomonadales bacterium]